MMMWGQGEDDTKGKHDPHTTILCIYVFYLYTYGTPHTHIYIMFTSTIVFRWQNLNEMQF